MEDPKVIYLGPACQKEGDGREWCEDDVWPQCECGCSSVRYVLESDAQSELAALREENKKVQKRYEDMTDRAVEFEAAAESAELGVSLGLQREAALREELDDANEDNRMMATVLEYKTRSLTAAEKRNAELKHELELSERGRIAMWGRSEEMATARDCIATNYNQLSYGATACKEKLVFAEQHIAELTNLIEKAHTWVDRNNCGGWDAYELRDQLAAALKPTESGASE